MNCIKFTFIALFLLFGHIAPAQKVGLVLSGGGAKGLYHIGVIKALEENNIPIDYISGTSMGAIVGGLYSIGYTPEEMEREFLSEQIKYWMSGKIQERYGYYFKQMRENAAMINIRIDKNKRGGFSAKIPSNIIPSNQIDMAFIEYFSGASVACENNFDNLVVPFRCVATDATRRREVVFKDGDLGRAIRMSMSIPLVFKAIKEDSTIYYDGGIFNNFPWQVLQEDFKPDIIIGSKCVEGHENPDENSLMDQVLTLTMMHTDYNLPDSSDIMLDRIFDDVSIMDFARAEYIIEQGYKDAMASMATIKERIARRSDPVELEARRQAFRIQMPPLVFDDYKISGLYIRQTEYVRKMLKLEQQELFTFDQFKSEFFKILAEGEVDVDYPNVTFSDSSQMFQMAMKMQTKPSFKVMVGGNISSTALNQAYLGFEYKRIGYTAQNYNLDFYLSPFYSSVWLGGRMDFFVKSPFYVEAGLMYNYYNYFRSNYGVVSRGSNLTYAKYSDVYGTATVGLPLSRHSVLSARFNVGQDDYRYYLKENYDNREELDHTRFRFLEARLDLERKSTNYRLYPTRGIYQNIAVMAIEGKERFVPGANGLELGFKEEYRNRYWFGARFTREDYFPVRSLDWFSWGYLVDVCLTNHPQFTTDYATNISSPAFLPTQHSKLVYMKEFRSPSFVAAGLMPTFEFTPNFYFKTGVYAFLPERYDDVKEGVRQRLRYIFDGSLVYQTIVGPISLSISKYDTRSDDWFLTFNFGYAIFNKKGINY